MVLDCVRVFRGPMISCLFHMPSDEFKGHSLLQAAREADMAKVKKTLALEIINFKHTQTHETALVSPSVTFSLLFDIHNWIDIHKST